MRQLKLLTIMVFFFSNSAFAQHVSEAPIFDLNADGSLGALHADTDNSVLKRSKRKVQYQINTSGLDVATPHTVWIVAFNNPEYCLTTPCSGADFPFVPGHDPRAGATFVNAGGGISDLEGNGNFAGTVYTTVNGVSGAEVVLGSGLERSKGADIRLVLRAHGQPASFEDLLAALKTYRGACNLENLVQPMPCRDYQISIHLPTNDD